MNHTQTQPQKPVHEVRNTQDHTRRSITCPTSNVGPLNPLHPAQVLQLEHEQHNMQTLGHIIIGVIL